MGFWPFLAIFDHFFGHNYLTNAPIDLIVPWATLSCQYASTDTQHDPLGGILIGPYLIKLFFWPFLAIFDHFFGRNYLTNALID